MKKRNRKLVIVALVLVVYVGLVGFLWQKKEQEVRSRATSATTITFSPDTSSTTPSTKKVNDTFSFDVLVSPGSNLISFTTLDIRYDQTKLVPDQTSPIVVNTQAFPQTLEGPTLSPGRIQIKLGIGSDPTRAISQITKAVTLQFKAIGPTGATPTVITAGSATNILSIARTDNSSENVLASSSPAYIVINGSGIFPTITPLPTLTPLVCNQASASADLMLVLDNSGSMNSKASNTDTTTKFISAQTAAKLFIDQFVQAPDVRIGLKAFSGTELTMQSPAEEGLSFDRAKMKAAVDGLKISTNSGTCLACAIQQVQAHLDASGRTDTKQAFVLLTDGKANATVTKPYKSDTDPGTTVSDKAALDAVTAIYAKYKPTIYVIGLGSDVNADVLKQIANQTGGKYYFPLSSDDLNAIYKEISQTIIKGSISGTVFHDSNTNGVFEQTEEKMSGWTVQATDPVSHAVYARTTSGGQGDYLLDNLCNGKTYQVEMLQQSGFTQTVPKNPAVYQVAITKGTAVTGKDFGVNETPKTTFNYSVYLHGIGNSGDNTNPDKFDFSNKSPVHPTKPVSITFLDANNQIAASLTGSMHYASSEGRFVGSVEAPIDTLQNASFIVKIGSERYLQKRLQDLQTVSVGKANTLSPITLTTGDVDSNNRLNILDYNMIIGCYQDISPAKSCTPTKKVQSDIDDDGSVNQTDYNLFLRELTVQNGD